MALAVTSNNYLSMSPPAAPGATGNFKFKLNAYAHHCQCNANLNLRYQEALDWRKWTKL